MTTITDIQKQQAKAVDILTLIGDTSSLKGNSELYGPCLICGGNDRMHVKPVENVWFCSHCTGRPDSNGWQDTISLAQLLHGLDFGEAVLMLTNSPAPPLRTPRPQPTPPPRPQADIPPADWQANAYAAAVTLADDLWRPEQAKARDWLNHRGIDDGAIYRYNLGYTSGGNVSGIEFNNKMGRGIVIPHWSQRYKTMFALKARRPVGKPKYYCATGSKPASSLFNSDSLAGKEICFVTEGELDTLALHSQISNLAAVVTLGSKGAKLPDRWLSDLYHVRRFIIVTDCGEDEAAAKYWLSLVGKRGRRFILPGSAKDICEAAESGLDIRDWAIAVMNSIGA